MEQLTIYAIYIVLIIPVFVSLYLCLKKQDKSSFMLCVSLTTLLVIVLLSTLPARNKVTSSMMSIEPKIDQIEQDQEELKKIVSALIKIQIISSDRALVIDQTATHKQLLEENIKSLSKYLNQNELSSLQSDLNNAVDNTLKQ